MRKQKALLYTLVLSFVLGLSMISSGLASLPPAHEAARTVILNPKMGEIIQDLRPKQLVDDETISTIAQAPKKPPENNKHERVIRKGETLAGILQGYGVDSAEVTSAIKEISSHFSLRQLRAGETVNIELFDKDGAKHIKKVFFKPSITKTVELNVKDEGFEVKVTTIELEKVLLKAKGDINGSFYQSAINAGVTPSVVSQLITALSYDVDFQRDIQPGNKFTILFEGMTTPEGEFIKSNRPIYVKLEMRKKTAEIYILQRGDGTMGYYNKEGVSARKALLRTPVDGVRITSGFGLRRHPILGYSKMHKGVDFGAPTGTPIYAAGDGSVEIAGYHGGYGNYVRIKHNDTYSTAYGHISRFPRGMKAGVRVKQGQIIAYVGSTGRSTGPHLHYEVLMKGKQINPVTAKLLSVENKLQGKEMAKFQAEKKRVVTALSDAPTRAELAKLIEEESENDAPEQQDGQDGQQAEGQNPETKVEAAPTPAAPTPAKTAAKPENTSQVNIPTKPGAQQ